MTAAYRKAIELRLLGTDLEITNNLKVLTAENIDYKKAVEWLREGGYWQEGPTGMAGTLVAIYAASSGDYRKRFDDCWGYLYSVSANELITTEVFQGNRINFLINQIPGVTGAVLDSFYTLGGGRPFALLTETEYALQRTSVVTEDALSATKEQMREEASTRYNLHIDAIDRYDGSGSVPTL